MADFLLWAAFLLFVASVLLLFIKFWWALLALFLAIIAYTLYIKTPKGKREQEKLQAQIREKERQAELARQAEAEEIKELENKVVRLSQDPIKDGLLTDILSALADIEQKKVAPLIESVLLPLLEIKPLDERVRATVLDCAKKLSATSLRRGEASSLVFYEAALNILQQNPGQSSLKQYALDVGRWHHSIARGSGTVTIYDEQAMQNDIMARLT